MLNGIAEIMLMAVVTGALVVQLIKVLGGKKFEPDEETKERARTAGKGRNIHEHDYHGDPRPTAEDGEANKTEDEKRFASQLAQARKYDPHFTLPAFLKGAEMAFPAIIDAYVNGDEDTLCTLCNTELCHAFLRSFAESENTGLRRNISVVKIRSATCNAFTLQKSKACISVRFVSEQIFTVRDKEDNVVEGHPSHIVVREEIWTFERQLKDPDPNWRLCQTAAPETPHEEPKDAQHASSFSTASTSEAPRA